MSDEWGFADMYSMDAEPKQEATDLTDVAGTDWRNILVLGRATPDGVYPETLALVGRARHIADELGCRVEVLLIGEHLDAATEALKQYQIDNVYRVAAPDYAPIDHTARILQEVVRKRRPEMVLVFQSRSGDAVTAYAASRLGVGFILGAVEVTMDTMERLATVTHAGSNPRFLIRSRMTAYPQFISVQRGLFRAPMEDPYASVKVYDLDIDAGKVADIRVTEARDPPEPSLAEAERVVIAGSRIHDEAGIKAAQDLATALDAAFAVSAAVHERGLAKDVPAVGWMDEHVHARLVVTVGARGSLDLLTGIEGEPVIAAVASSKDDAIARKAAYLVEGDMLEAIEAIKQSL